MRSAASAGNRSREILAVLRRCNLSFQAFILLTDGFIVGQSGWTIVLAVSIRGGKLEEQLFVLWHVSHSKLHRLDSLPDYRQSFDDTMA